MFSIIKYIILIKINLKFKPGNNYYVNQGLNFCSSINEFDETKSSH